MFVEWFRTFLHFWLLINLQIWICWLKKKNDGNFFGASCRLWACKLQASPTSFENDCICHYWKSLLLALLVYDYSVCWFRLRLQFGLLGSLFSFFTSLKKLDSMTWYNSFFLLLKMYANFFFFAVVFVGWNSGLYLQSVR